MFKSKVEKYMSLPADYHRAIPVPEALVYYSKRGVYASPKTDKTTPCAYATVLKLQAENIPVGFLYPEYMEPLAGRKYDANMLLIDEHHPVSKGGWRDIRKWLAKGGRVVIYGGKPGCDWDTAAEQKKFPKEMEQLFGVKLAKCGRHFRKIDPSPIDKPLPSVMSGLDVTPMGNATVLKLAGGKPFVTINETGRKSLAVYVAAPICELPVAFLSRLCTWLLKQVGKKIVSVNTPLEVEVCLYKNEGKFYVAAKNHSCEKRRAEFGIKTGWRPRKITELMHEAPVKGYRFSKGKTVFSDVPDANSVRIYEITL